MKKWADEWKNPPPAAEDTYKHNMTRTQTGKKTTNKRDVHT